MSASAARPVALYVLPPLDLSSDEGGDEDCPLPDYTDEDSPDEDEDEETPDIDEDEDTICAPLAA